MSAPHCRRTTTWPALSTHVLEKPSDIETRRVAIVRCERAGPIHAATASRCPSPFPRVPRRAHASGLRSEGRNSRTRAVRERADCERDGLAERPVESRAPRDRQSRSMIVTLSKTSLKTRAAHMPAKLPPITRALRAGVGHSRRGRQLWRRPCAGCRCNIGGCQATPSHEHRPSGRENRRINLFALRYVAIAHRCVGFLRNYSTASFGQDVTLL